jgi:hypothetical protein
LNQKIPFTSYPVHLLLLEYLPDAFLVKRINHRFEFGSSILAIVGFLLYPPGGVPLE